jgi:hypothetical protein
LQWVPGFVCYYWTAAARCLVLPAKQVRL